MKKITLVSLIVVAIIAIIGVFSPTTTVVEKVTEVKENLGAFAGPDILNNVVFYENYKTRGHVATTTTASTYTLTSKEINPKISYLEINVDNALTATTMASTTAPFSQLAIGEGFTMDLLNSGDSTLTFAAGTGVDIQEDTGGALTVATLEMAKLYFRKKTNGDVLMWIHVGQLGD